MVANLHNARILLVEPNQAAVQPYSWLDSLVKSVDRCQTTTLASQMLVTKTFDLVIVSCSFSARRMLHFLEEIKAASKQAIMPLILVVDLTRPYSLVPGLQWAQRLSILSSNSSAEELELALHRLLLQA